jgi:hypothetical protein
MGEGGVETEALFFPRVFCICVLGSGITHRRVLLGPIQITRGPLSVRYPLKRRAESLPRSKKWRRRPKMQGIGGSGSGGRGPCNRIGTLVSRAAGSCPGGLSSCSHQHGSRVVRPASSKLGCWRHGWQSQKKVREHRVQSGSSDSEHERRGRGARFEAHAGSPKSHLAGLKPSRCRWQAMSIRQCQPQTLLLLPS